METALLVALVAAALVGMSVYVQRAYQGYLYGNTSVQGPQFDPTQPSSDTQRLNDYVLTQTSTTVLDAPSASLPRGNCRRPAEGCLPDMAGGQMAGRTLRSSVTTAANWDVSRDATFNAQ